MKKFISKARTAGELDEVVGLIHHQNLFGTKLEYEHGEDRIGMTVPIKFAETAKSAYVHSKEENDSFWESVRTIPMDDEWVARIKPLSWYHETRGELTPNMEAIRDKLLDFAGQEVCILHGDDRDTENILHCGQFWFGKLSEMTTDDRFRMRNQCHANSIKLYQEYKDKRDIHFCTGFALSDDGMWREHSWCISRDSGESIVIETTEPRILYYGYVIPEKLVEDWTK
jgi:hypothetical protein